MVFNALVPSSFPQPGGESNYRNSHKISDGKYAPKKSDTRADPLQNKFMLPKIFDHIYFLEKNPAIFLTKIFGR